MTVSWFPWVVLKQNYMDVIAWILVMSFREHRFMKKNSLISQRVFLKYREIVDIVFYLLHLSESQNTNLI